jgi:hypothetical protein
MTRDFVAHMNFVRRFGVLVIWRQPSLAAFSAPATTGDLKAANREFFPK